jgi:hypothetical protein
MSKPDLALVEALDLLRAAKVEGLPIKLLGGIAIKAVCPSSRREPFLRPCSDMDFVSLARPGQLEAFFALQGWDSDRQFNLYNGETRLAFLSPGGCKADVFVGTFKMCHEVPLAGRLGLDGESLPLADLLLTKLQVVEANAKDLSDAACILADHGLGTEDGESVSLARITGLCGADWGLWRTVTLSLAKLGAWTSSQVGEDGLRTLILERIQGILDAMDSCPKSLGWKLRAKIGERLRWYEVPEEGQP